MMSNKEANYRSLASCGAVLIVFIGLCHEFVGRDLFSWGPAFFGGLLGWYLVGAFLVVIGLLLLGGTLRFMRLPVVPIAISLAIFALVVGAYTAFAHQQFHFFAFSGVVAAVAVAFFTTRQSSRVDTAH